MWISKYKYNRIIERLDNLERAADVPYTSAPVGRLMRMLMDHLGVNHRRTEAHDEIVKKGGPEKP